jgi:alkaline phosphatase D
VSSPIDRRRFLQGAAALGVAAVGSACRSPWTDWHPRPLPPLELPVGWDFPVAAGSAPPFCHGVASGDPLADRVVIWSRLTLPDPRRSSMRVRWRMALDPEMRHVVAAGGVRTGADRDWTVKVDVGRLQPGQTYYYDFATEGRYSPVGRTRTAPRLADGIGVGVVSCSSYWSGHWNAYDRLAERDDIDLVVHCGDHIYDFADGGEWVRARKGRFDEEDVDFRPWRSMEENRRRYALHYADPSFLALHLAHPLTIAWDNHDIDGGSARLQSQQVFWEWTPCRPADPTVDRGGNLVPRDVSRDHRHLRYGDVDLFVLDLRTRSDAVTILGAEQREWFRSGLQDSAAGGIPWRLVVNPIPIARIVLGTRDYGGWTDRPDDQESMLRFLGENGIDDCLFLAGDAHGAFVADLPVDQHASGYDPATGAGSVGVEILANSITRGGLDETLAETIYTSLYGSAPKADRARLEPLLAQATAAARNVETGLLATNPALRSVNWRDHGYGVVRLTPEAAILEQWLVPHLAPSPAEQLGARFTVARGSNHAVPVS